MSAGPDQAPPNPFGRAVLNHPGDFVPEWDVPSFGAQPTTDLLRAITTLDGGTRVDPDRRIEVLLAPPGYGKTHLFGRLAHRLGERVLFVFVPPLQDIRRPLPHIRHHVVTSLFAETPDGRPRIARLLAALCRESFVKYVASLPRPLDGQYAVLLSRLQAGHDAVLEIVDHASSLPPFQRVGDSLQSLYPQLNANVLRALALGWSPEADHACRGLRGEAIGEEHARRIGLPDDPPDPIDAIKAVGVLAAGFAPVVVCIDQIDNLLADLESVPKLFSTAVMTIREQVPNLVIVLSCLKGEWGTLRERFLGAFTDRTRTHDLGLLTEAEAVELVHSRLKGWPAAPHDADDWWPLDERALRAWLAAQQLVRPRALLDACKARYDEWAERGELGARITFGQKVAADPLVEFRREWDKELAAAEADKTRWPENAQDQRVAKALKEGLGLLAATPGPLQPKAVRDDPLAQVQTGNSPYRYSFEVVFDGRKAVVIALQVAHSTQQFAHYFKAIRSCLDGGVAGAVLVTAKEQVWPSGATKAGMEEETARGRLRVLALTDYRDDYARLDAFVELLQRAAGQNLQLAGATIDAARCRELVAESGVLSDLPLFGRVLGGWGDAPKAPEPLGSTESSGALAEERLVWAADGQDFIAQRLGELGARVRSIGSVEIGPTFARFLVSPYPATTIGKVRSRAEDLKVGLGVDSLPIVGSQGGAITIDVQLPERYRRVLRLAGLGPAPAVAAPAFPVGQDVAGQNHWLDLSDPNSCHLLVAGTTGSGKSVFLKALIAMLARGLGPGRVAFALVDPKQVTFNFGDRTGGFLIGPVANTADEALVLVTKCFDEVERRYAELKKRSLEDLAQWQAADPDAPPRLVFVCDEFAALMADRATKQALEAPLKRLGAKARAAGVHLVLATQRPEASVVTPLLRSNLPARICFRVASAADSRLILKEPDAADLLGRGDLIWQRGAGSVRLQGLFVERAELEAALFSGSA